MEIGRLKTPRRISSNASQITPPANKSTKRCAKWHYDWPAHRMHEITRLDLDLYTARRPSNIQSLSTFVDRASQVPTIQRVPKYSIDENTRMQQDKGCGKKRRYYHYYYCSKKKKIGAREKRVLAPENKLQHDS